MKQSLPLILQSFLPLIAFYGFEHFFGLKAAIAGTIVVAIAEFAYRRWKKEDLGAFFYFVTISTVGFGLIDVFSTNTSFFKYEPALTNVLTAFYFAWGAMTPKPMLQELVEKTKKISSEHFQEELVLYFRILTWLWVLYFFGKGIVYYVIADEPDATVDKMILVRSVVGNVSMFAMVGVSWLMGKPIVRYLMKRKAQRLSASASVKE